MTLKGVIDVVMVVSSVIVIVIVFVFVIVTVTVSVVIVSVAVSVIVVFSMFIVDEDREKMNEVMDGKMSDRVDKIDEIDEDMTE